MRTFDDITAARRAINRFDADTLPPYMLDRFEGLAASPSPVDQIVGVGEFVWANRDRVPDAAKDLGGGLIAFATTNAWHGLLEDDRGNAIVANLRKDLGEISKAPAAPDARPGYLLEDPADRPDDAAPPVPAGGDE